MKSPLQAIKEYCMECSGDSKEEVLLCPRTDCPLYPYRATLLKKKAGEKNGKEDPSV
jgi:hypothetical protein